MSRKIGVACVFALILGLAAFPAMADPGRGTDVQCYLWAQSASSSINVPYTPSATYSFNASGRAAANTVTRTATGTYTVTCKGVGGGSAWGPGGHVQVTAYGSEDADYCKVQNWGTGGADFTAIVKCYNSAGGASDSRFDLLFIW
jgi:hypothetical protein